MQELLGNSDTFMTPQITEVSLELLVANKELELLNIRIVLVKVTINIGQEKYLLLISYYYLL